MDPDSATSLDPDPDPGPLFYLFLTPKIMFFSTKYLLFFSLRYFASMSQPIAKYLVISGFSLGNQCCGSVRFSDGSGSDLEKKTDPDPGTAPDPDPAKNMTSLKIQ